jgi:hypothetical protein
MGMKVAAFFPRIAGILVVILMVATIEAGYDYFENYRPAAENWVQGDSQLYDEQSLGFYNAPWLMVLLVPTLLFPAAVGAVIVSGSSWLVILESMRAVRHLLPLAIPGAAFVLAVVNFPVFNLLYLSQIDALMLVGVVMGWWAVTQDKPWVLGWSLCLLAIKPMNVALVALLFLLSLRRWSDVVKAVMPSLVTLITFTLLIGIDWPLRYLDNLEAREPNTMHSKTIWDAVEFLNLPAIPFIIWGVLSVGLVLYLGWRNKTTPLTLTLALATNFIFTTYAYSHHYVALIPCFLYVAAVNKSLMWLLYPLLLMPLFNILLGDSTLPTDVLYPLSLYGFALIQQHDVYRSRS